MIFFALALLPLAWLAHPVTLTSKLDFYDRLRGDEKTLLQLYKVEADGLAEILRQQLVILKEDPIALIKGLRNFGFLKANETPAEKMRPILDVVGVFQFISDRVLPAAQSTIVMTEMEAKERGFVMALLDQAIQAIIEKHAFMISRSYINDEGKITASFCLERLFQMPERHTSPRTWIRIMFAMLDALPQNDFNEVIGFSHYERSKIQSRGMKNQEATDYMLGRARLTEDLLTRMLRLQYISCLIFNVNMRLPERNRQISLATTVTSYWALCHLNIPGDHLSPEFNAAFQKGFTLLTGQVGFTLVTSRTAPIAKDARKVITVSVMGDLYQFLENEGPFLGDRLLIEMICKVIPELRSTFPLSRALVEKICEMPVEVEQEQLDEIMSDGGNKGKKEKKSRSTSQKTTRKTEKSKVQVLVEKPLDYDSDESEDSVASLTDTLESLSFDANSADWKPTEAWLTAAKVYLAQYCRVTWLIPLRTKKYPNDIPDDFSWKMLLDDSSDPELVFCVNVTMDRNITVKGDKIFEFLPTVQQAVQSLQPHFTFDRKALGLLLSFAPGKRLQETSVANSLLLPQTTVGFNLLILGLYPACQRAEAAGLEIPELTQLCSHIRGKRKSVAHPTISPAWFELLKKEFTQWVTY